MLVQERARIGRRRQCRQNRSIHGVIPLTAAGGNDHVHARQQVRFAFDTSGIQRESRGVGADALPRLHLPLIATLRYLLVEVE